MAARTRNPFGGAPLWGSGNGIEREGQCSLCLPPRRKLDSQLRLEKSRDGKGMQSWLAYKASTAFCFFFSPPTFPPLSECESGSNVDPRDASSPSPPSFKCAFFLFSFTSTKQKTETAVPSLPPLSMKSVALSTSRIIVEKSFFREPASSRRIK